MQRVTHGGAARTAGNPRREAAAAPTARSTSPATKHIKASLPPNLDPHQFAYRANRSTEDAIAAALHTVLSHLEHLGNYVRILFIDYSSAFNTIIPDILVNKLSDLDFPPLTWIKDFLNNRPQTVKWATTAPPPSLSTGLCTESTPLYSVHLRLYSHQLHKLHYEICR